MTTLFRHMYLLIVINQNKQMKFGYFGNSNSLCANCAVENFKIKNDERT